MSGRLQKLAVTALVLPALAESALRLALRQDPRQFMPRRWPGLRLPPAEQLAAGIDRWLRWMQHPRPCLPRALALGLLLRRCGEPVVLHLGVERAPAGAGPFKGHAWLSLHGQPYLEPRAECLRNFVETLRVPST